MCEFLALRPLGSEKDPPKIVNIAKKCRQHNNAVCSNKLFEHKVEKDLPPPPEPGGTVRQQRTQNTPNPGRYWAWDVVSTNPDGSVVGPGCVRRGVPFPGPPGPCCAGGDRTTCMLTHVNHVGQYTQFLTQEREKQCASPRVWSPNQN